MSRVLSIDAGTTGVRALVVDERGRVLARGYREFPQVFPQPGWVEHNPDDWWDAMLASCTEARAGKLAFGTVDSYLLARLTGGAVHATDRTNASRTMLFDIHGLAWDGPILERLGIPEAMLPEVRPSSGPFGTTGPERFLGAAVPICGIAGDQQAALFGQACFAPGQTKNTYGTGSF